MQETVENFAHEVLYGQRRANASTPGSRCMEEIKDEKNTKRYKSVNVHSPKCMSLFKCKILNKLQK